MAKNGDIIAGKYEVLREIGHGGMSVVYLAMDTHLVNKQWAIKEFRKDKNDSENMVAYQALKNEANIMKKLDHPTLPRIVDIVDEQDTLYVIMDYIEGENLKEVLEKYGVQSQENVIRWAKQLSEVLLYLHSQSPKVIYRDMKPANIMLKPDGSVRLIDFGIAREYKEGKKGDTTVVGTREYAAPEQIQGTGQTDERTDIYSLGITLHHLVTGKSPAEPPYEIRPIRQYNRSLSSGLEWLITKCTQLSPKDRLQSCAEVIYVLNNLPKFEYDYWKKIKSKINIFVTLAALTAVFGLASVGSFFGASAMKKNTVANYIQQGDYVSAIETDEENPEPYIKQVEKLRENAVTIYGGNDETHQAKQNEYKKSDIISWFSNERLAKILKVSPQDYATIKYELGRLFWNGYFDDSGQQMAATSEAMPYFESVITLAQESDLKNAGLNDQKFNLAKAYFLVSYFQINKSNLQNQDDGQFTASDAAVAADVYGINSSNNTIENPYYSFWVTNKNLLEMISGDTDISDKVKLESLKRIAYIVAENYSDFYKYTKDKSEKVDGAEMTEFFSRFKAALANISQSEENDAAKAETVKTLNGFIPSIEALYDVEIEVIA